MEVSTDEMISTWDLIYNKMLRMGGPGRKVDVWYRQSETGCILINASYGKWLYRSLFHSSIIKIL